MGILLGLLEEVQKNESTQGDKAHRRLPSICIIERGDGVSHQRLNSGPTVLPQQWYTAAHSADSAVLYQGQHKKLTSASSHHRETTVPVGTGIGGTSNINACLCLPPAEDDFEQWPEPFHSQLLPAIDYILARLEANNAIERHTTSALSTHEDKEGKVTSHEAKSLLQRRNTFPLSTDTVQCNVRHDQHRGQSTRCNYYHGLIEPLIQQIPQYGECITWITGHHAERILIEGQTAASVEVRSVTSSSEPVFRTVQAEREIILCAGAIESPALLQVSGIGRPVDHRQLMQFRNDAPVGDNLRDHTMMVRAYFRREKMAVKYCPNGVQAIHCFEINKQRYQAAVMDGDPLTFQSTLPGVVASLFRWKCNSKSWDAFSVLSFLLYTLVYSILWLLLRFPPFFYVLRHYVTILTVSLLNPRSTGHVHIVMPDRHDGSTILRRSRVQLDIQLPYLTNPADCQSIVEGWIASRAMASPPDGVAVFPDPLFPLTNTRSQQQFQSYARATCLPYYHFCGTCRMPLKDEKDDNNCVVDSLLRVCGVARLRVCDASVFPYLPSAPIALTCLALGYITGKRLVQEE